MRAIRFGQMRAARRVLDLKERVVAGILQMPHAELRKGERLDSVIPSPHAELARQLIRLAERVTKSPGPRIVGQTPRGVSLPFERPRCFACRYPLNVTVTAYSSRRGDYWYFKCPKCGQRYWSKDGRAHPVSPKGGNWSASKTRPRCDVCRVECSIKSGRYWECPKCRKRFRDARGRAVPTVRGYSAVRPLPFLRERKCPNCESSHLWIKAVPRPPKVRHFYFRCSSCERSCRFDKRLGRLVLLRVRSRVGGGRRLARRASNGAIDMRHLI
jgi:hypothetical protein